MGDNFIPDPSDPSGFQVHSGMVFDMPEGVQAGEDWGQGEDNWEQYEQPDNGYRVGISMNAATWFQYKHQRVQDLVADLEPEAHDKHKAPSNLEIQRKYVERLFRAFKNTHKIVDKQCKGGKICQAGQRIEQGYYPDDIIEQACWELFDHAQTAQLGIQLVEPYHCTTKEPHPDFDARWNAIVETFARSKAACKQALDPLFMHRLADAPASELKLKLNNKRINAQRDLQNSVGRTILKQHKSQLETDDSDPFKLESNGLDNLHLIDASYDALDPDEEDYDHEFKTPQKRSAQKPTPSAKRTPKTPKNGITSYTLPDADKPSMSTGKRKQAHPPMYADAGGDDDDDGDEDDDDGDATYQDLETPVKRRTKGRSMKGQQLTKPIAIGRTRASRKASYAKKSPAPKFEFPPGAGIILFTEQEESEYKGRLCELLGINLDLGAKFTLRELRFYAYAYDRRFTHKVWYYSAADGTTGFGKGFNVIFPDGSKTHFAMIFKEFIDIAYARGDLDGHGRLKADSPTHSGFDVGSDVLLHKALGTAMNPFGTVDFALALGVAIPPFISGATQTGNSPVQAHGERSSYSDYHGAMGIGIPQHGRQTGALYSAGPPFTDSNDSFMGGAYPSAYVPSYKARVLVGAGSPGGFYGSFVGKNTSFMGADSFSSTGTPVNSDATGLSFTFGPSVVNSIPASGSISAMNPFATTSGSFNNGDSFMSTLPVLTGNQYFNNGSSMNTISADSSFNNGGASMSTPCVPAGSSFDTGGSSMTSPRIPSGGSINSTGSAGFTPQLPTDGYFTNGASFMSNSPGPADNFFNNGAFGMYTAPLAPLFTAPDNVPHNSSVSGNGFSDGAINGDEHIEGSHDGRDFNFTPHNGYPQILQPSPVRPEKAFAHFS